MSPARVRSYRGSLFRSYCDELRRTGSFEDVRRTASPALAGLLDDPRRAPSWIEAGPIDEVTAAIHARRGAEGVRELGYHAMKSGFTKVLEPIIHLAFSIAGSPASLLSRAHLMLAVVARGASMEWKSAGPKAGTLTVRYEGQVPPINFIAWEGCALYVLELARAKGTVGGARVSADGKTAEIDVGWA